MLFKLFTSKKSNSSEKRIGEGLKAEGFRNISHVPGIFRESRYLYVGSVTKNIHSRLSSHLGFGSGRTGALHLAEILKEIKVHPKMTFNYCMLDEKYKNLTKHIECVMQNKLKPIIGKLAY